MEKASAEEEEVADVVVESTNPVLNPVEPGDDDEEDLVNQHESDGPPSFASFDECKLGDENDDGFDDFADFQTHGFKDELHSVPVANDCQPDSNCGNPVKVDDINQVSVIKDNDSFGDDFDDFADFQTGGGQGNELESRPPPPPRPSVEESLPETNRRTDVSLNVDDLSNNKEVISKLDLVISDIFPKTTTTTDFAQVEEAFDSDAKTIVKNIDTVTIHKDCDAPSSTVWKNLQNLEEAPCLQLKWMTSHSFETFLGSLNIDFRNILPPQRLPHLSLLEPTQCLQPTPLTSSSSSSLGHQPLSSAPVAVAAIGQSTTAIASNRSVKSNDSKMSREVVSTTDNLEHSSSSSSSTKIPPVDFDWISSGLVNPFNESNGGSSVRLDDLSFLVDEEKNNGKEETKSIKSISKLEEELLTPEPVKKQLVNESKPGAKIKSDPLQELLSKVNYTKSVPSLDKRAENLSGEAAHVLDELPILSFIRAKVLMFPVNEPSYNAHH